MPKKSKKLPKSARRVFKGVIFEVWQWKQKMFDGSTAVFERLKRADTVNVIGTVGDKVIILKQKQPDWDRFRLSLAGGRVEAGETALQSAKREFLEEAGYISEDWVLWKKIDPVMKVIWTVHNYFARNCVKKQESSPDAGEKLETKLISFDAFLKLADDPDFYEGELKSSLIRARFDQKYQKEFKKLLFGKKG